MIAVPLTGFLDLITDYMKQYVNTFALHILALVKNDLSNPCRYQESKK